MWSACSKSVVKRELQVVCRLAHVSSFQVQATRRHRAKLWGLRNGGRGLIGCPGPLRGLLDTTTQANAHSTYHVVELHLITTSPRRYFLPSIFISRVVVSSLLSISPVTHLSTKRPSCLSTFIISPACLSPVLGIYHIPYLHLTAPTQSEPCLSKQYKRHASHR